MFKYIYSAVVVLSINLGYAQHIFKARNFWIQQDVQLAMDFLDLKEPGSQFHSSFKPYLSGYCTDFKDSLAFSSVSHNRFLKPKYYMGLGQFTWESTPIINGSFSRAHKTAAYDFTYGTEHAFLVKSNLAFVLNWSNTWSQHYLLGDSSWIALNQTSSLGLITDRNRQKQRISSELYQGYISFNPGSSKYFNLQAGKGKHVVGDGFRSLLHSDNAPAYPYAQISAKAWRLQYHVWYAALQHQSPIDPASLLKKYATFHYLSYKGPKGFQLGFFESVIWAGTDSLRYRTWDVTYLNPVIFLRPVEYHNGSPDNVIMGLNGSAVFFKTLKVYAQFALDEFLLKEIFAGNNWWGNKYAWQLGAKIRLQKNILIQTEYNRIRPFTYSHMYTAQNYAHAGYALAHPNGSNLNEMFFQAIYRHRRMAFNVLCINRLQGIENPSENLGNNLFKSYNSRPRDYNFGIALSPRSNTTILQSGLGYLLQAQHNLWFKISGWISQNIDKQTVIKTGFQVSLTSGLWNNPVFPVNQ